MMVDSWKNYPYEDIVEYHKRGYFRKYDIDKERGTLPMYGVATVVVDVNIESYFKEENIIWAQWFGYGIGDASILRIRPYAPEQGHYIKQGFDGNTYLVCGVNGTQAWVKNVKTNEDLILNLQGNESIRRVRNGD